MSNLIAQLDKLKEYPNADSLPALFIGHGSPMNAIEDNQYSKSWKALGEKLPKPKAILSISAHWITQNTTKVTAMDKPRTIYDFGGFPDVLYQQVYPAAGSPTFAKETIDLITKTQVIPDYQWGLDNGTWSVLLPMFPLAEIPVYQLSIDYSKPPIFHYELGQELKILREKGVLIIGSGNIVHNLSALTSSPNAYDWAIEFDSKIKSLIDKEDYSSIVKFQEFGSITRLAHPTYDHFLPLLYILALKKENDSAIYFNETFDFGSLSMRSLILG